jgi:hypothetical protein
MKLNRISCFVHLVCLLSIVSVALVGLVVVLPRNADGYGCLVAYSNDRNTTYLLDTQTGQMRAHTLLTPAQVGPNTDYVSRFFKDETTAVYWAQRGGKEELLVALNIQNKQLSIVPTYNSATSLRRSADGKYLAAFEAGTSTNKNLVIYSLPDLQPVITRSWSTPFNFYAIEWSPLGNQLAYLEQNTNNEVVLTLIDPDLPDGLSSVVISGASTYQGSYLLWSPDSEAVALYTHESLDLYLLKSQIFHHVIDGFDLTIGRSVMWIGDRHLLLYNRFDKQRPLNYWVYDPDNDRQTPLETKNRPYIIFSPDNKYAAISYPDTSGQETIVSVNVETGQHVPVRQIDAPIAHATWLNGRDEFIFDFPDRLVWMRLDGTKLQEVRIAVEKSYLYLLMAQAQNWIVYSRYATDQSVRLGIVNLDTGFHRLLAELSEGAGLPYLSPDAKIVALNGLRGPSNSIALSLFAADGRWSHTFRTTTSEYYSDLLWSPDSTKLALIGKPNLPSKIDIVYILTADGRLLKQIDLPSQDLRFETWNNCELP